MTGYRVISSDDHVMEPPDLWTSGVALRFRERAPHIVRLEDGSDWWVCDGRQLVHMGSGSQTGRRFEEPDKLSREDIFENVRPGGYVSEEWIKDMDADGVDVSIIYPSAGLLLYSLPDSALVTALFKTYNDWLAEFCRLYPNRLQGIAMLNLDHVPEGVKELERCAKTGLAGAMITVYPPEGRAYDSAEYELLWAAAQDLEMPLGLHLGTNRPGPGQQAAPRDSFKPAFLCNADYWVRISLAHMIYSGVFERYPKLQVGAVEHELSWVPHFLERLDYTYSQRASGMSGHRFKEDLLPSDYFHRNVFLSFQEDALARIHRRTSLGTALEEASGCSSESGIMVLEQKPARKQGAPNRCCHRTNPTVSASSLTPIAWWPMPACSCRPP